MSTAQRVAIASPAAGLLLFNTDLNRLEYYGGASIGWTSGSGHGWSLTGNAGTIDTVNFLGTTDNVPLNFGVNNQKAGKIDLTKQNSFSVLCWFSNNSGTNNSAYRANAMQSNVAGSNATAIGTNAMQFVNNSTIPFTIYNVAVGFEAIRGSETSSENTGISNTAIGYQALRNNSAEAGIRKQR
ncbi:MAG: hypothetical protein IPH88_17070 [Bacteroidales bacterium]|nr:hypothetical protein [Bacteroidales bacterium]